jgi:nucleotidyltransferase/DNA polymerase involved in DNA repair
MQASSSNLIAHFDLDSFFVSVEYIRDPTLKGKAVIVGGSKERGIVPHAVTKQENLVFIQQCP